MNYTKPKTITNIVNKRGFTLIELLVAISIISVFASMLLVAVERVKNKAKNSVINQTITQYRNALELYRVTNNSYPIIDESWHCLGTGYPGGICGYVNSSSPTTESATLSNLLRPYIKNQNPISTERLNVNAVCSEEDIAMDNCYIGDDTPRPFVGAQYVCSEVWNGRCKTAGIAWALKGSNQSCSVPDATSLPNLENTFCFFSLFNQHY